MTDDTIPTPATPAQFGPDDIDRLGRRDRTAPNLPPDAVDECRRAAEQLERRMRYTDPMTRLRTEREIPGPNVRFPDRGYHSYDFGLSDSIISHMLPPYADELGQKAYNACTAPRRNNRQRRR